MPPTLHPEEAKLVSAGRDAAASGEPSLLADVAGLLSAGAPDVNTLARRGRAFSAFFGGLVVVLVWGLARAELRHDTALLAAGTVAVSPLLVLSAHEFAPGTPALALGLATIGCLTRLQEQSKLGWALAAGALGGAATATHWGGTLLVLCAAVLLALTPAPKRASYSRRLAQAGAVALVVFALLNVRSLASFETFLGASVHEARRLAGGDHLFLPGWRVAFSFHLRETLPSAASLPILILGTGGLLLALGRRRSLSPETKGILVYAGLAWLIAEISPLKPTPGAERYMLPVLPALGIGFGLAAEELRDRTQGRASPFWLSLVLLVPLLSTAGLLRTRADDPRVHAGEWLAVHGGRTLCGPHASTRPAAVASLASVDLDAARRSGVTHVVASSFVYETFQRGTQSAAQAPYVYERHARYQELFAYPYEEFAPDGPTLGWWSPTIRVVDIRDPRPPGRP